MMEMSPTDYVVAFASSVTAMGVLFLWWQARLLRQQVQSHHAQMVADHERSRRQLAVSLLQHWNRSVSPASVAAERIVNSLTNEQARAIANVAPVDIDERSIDLLEACLGESTAQLTASNGKVSLNKRQVNVIRYLALDYLNETEAVLCAWQMGIADTQTIEDQFHFLCDPRQGHDALQRFRQVMGDDLWPSIREFVKRFGNRQLTTPPARAPLP